MKLFKLAIATAVAGLVIGGNSSVRASTAPTIDFDTYVFTGTTDHTFDGSTITIEGSIAGHLISDWDLIGNGVELKPDNSGIDITQTLIIAYDDTTWTGHFNINDGSNFFIGESSDSDGSLDLNQVDPPGAWAPAGASAAPDAANSLQLFALGIIALSSFRFWNKKRTARVA